MASDPILQTATRTVLIGCKHPNGVTLNLDHYVLRNAANNLVQRINGKATVTLRGWSYPFGKPDPGEGVGGYVLTPVPADFWDQWLAEHEDFAMLEDKTILGPHRDAKTQARDHAEVPKMHAPSSDELKELDAASYKKDD